jgi:hypothetical protein
MQSIHAYISCLSSVHLPFFIVYLRKLAGATCADPKEAGIGKQIAMASNCNAQQPMECLTGKEQKAKCK